MNRNKTSENRRRPVLSLTVLLLTLLGLLLLLVIIVSSLHQREPGGPAEESNSNPEVRSTAEGTWLELDEGQTVQVEYGSATGNSIDGSLFQDASTKNARDLAAWAKMAWENQWGYVWGTFGQILTEDLLANRISQYPDDLNEYADLVREKWMGRRVVDCAGLIKSYGWYNPLTDTIEYNTNGMPDTGTDSMWNAASVKGELQTMPEEPGVLVYSSKGHIGVYIGDGYAVEAISHRGGVVKTRVEDRPWTGWLECPYILYGEAQA